MVTTVATITGKVLIQIADHEPVEVGTVEIPIYAGTQRPKTTRSHELAATHVSITPDISLAAAAEQMKDAWASWVVTRGVAPQG